MEYPQVGRPLSSKILIVLEVFYGILGLISGFLLIYDPSGASLGFTSDIKEKIPFQSFLPVGLFLFLIYGAGSLILAYGAVTRKELIFEKISQIGKHHWSWVGGMTISLALAIWLMVEGSLIGLDYPATYFTVLIGGAIFILLALPSSRRYYKMARKDNL